MENQENNEVPELNTEPATQAAEQAQVTPEEETTIASNVEPLVQEKKARPKKGLIAVLIVLAALVVLAGGAFGALRLYENNSLADAHNKIAAGDFQGAILASDNILRFQNLLANPVQFHALKAEAEFGLQDYSTALAELDIAQAGEPDDVALRALRAKICYAQADLPAAYQAAEQVLAVDGSNGLALSLLALRDYRDNDFDAALKEAGQAIQNDSSNEIAFRIRGAIHAWHYEYQNAKADLDKAIQLDPQDVEARALRIYTSLSYEYTADAEDIQKVDSLKDNPFALWGSALQKAHQYDFAGAQGLIDQAIKLDHTRPEFFYTKGAATTLRSQNQIAVDAYKEALKLNPDFVPAQVALIENSMYLHDFEKFSDLTDQIQQIAPQATHGWYDLGEYQVETYQFEDAQTTAGVLIDKFPNAVDGYLLKGDIFTQMREFDQAKEAYQQATEKEPDSINLLLSKMNLAIREKDFSAAEDLFEAGKTLNPNEVNLYIFHAMVAQANADMDTAKADLDKALEIDPENSGIDIALVTYYITQKDLTDAYQQADLIQNELPKHYYGAAMRSLIYMADHNIDRAREEALKAIEIEKGYADGFYILANSYLIDGDMDSSLSFIKNAIDINPYQPNYYTTLGQAYFGKSAFSQAYDNYTKAIEMGDDGLDAQISKGDAEYHLFKFADAVTTYQAVMDKKDQLSIDQMDYLTSQMQLVKYLPPDEDGFMHFDIKGDGFEIKLTVPDDYLPISPEDPSIVLELSPNGENFGMSYIRVITASDPSFWGASAYDFAQAFRSVTPSLVDNYKWISEKTIKANGITGMEETFSYEDQADDGTTYTYINKMYIFSSKDRYISISLDANSYFFGHDEGNVDDIALSFEWDN